MSRRPACARAVLGIAIALATTTAISAGPPAASREERQLAQLGPEHARLTAMTGTWDVELTFWPRPGGTPAVAKGTSTIRSLFDGLFIEEKIEGALNGAPFATLAWTGFNTATRQYEATRIATTNPGRIAETGDYDEKAGRFELKAEYAMAGDRWRQRTIIRSIAADSMIAESYLSFGKVPEWKAVEIKYARKAK